MKPCPNCPSPRRPVPSDGPIPCRLLFIGEAPSYEEDRHNIPFCGKTGIELNNTYFPILGIPRSMAHIGNARWCSNKGYENPTPEEAARCSAFHLSELLQCVKPEVIVPMGVVACSLFEPEGFSLNLEHGIPRLGRYGPWEGILYPMYHPTAGMHPGTAGYMIPLMADFDELGKLLKRLDRNQFEFPEDPFPNPDYRIIRTLDDQVSYMPEDWFYEDGKGLWPRGKDLACDTESLPDGTPYCLTFSHTPGTGRLIYASDKEAIRRFGNLMRVHQPHMIFQNYLHDIEVFNKMGLPPLESFYDTMVRAYNLCLGGGGDDEDESRAGRGSLGLKVLAYRHCAMRMTSFKETVFPHSIPKMLAYLWKAEGVFAPDKFNKAMCECGHLNTSHSPRGKTQRLTGNCLSCPCEKFKAIKKPKATSESKQLDLLHRKIYNIIEGLESRKEDLDPWKRIKAWEDYDQNCLVDTCGPYPIPSIEHVPEPLLPGYAVRDADATLRLKHALEPSSWIFFN